MTFLTVLITGINGFAASYLAKVLLEKEIEVHGIARGNSSNYRHVALGIADHPLLTIHHGDVMDRKSMEDIIRKVHPEVIYNLAAIMYVQYSWDIPDITFKTNTIGILNILDIVKNLDRNIRIVQAGTSEEYGLVRANELPITEENHLRPMSPYGISKVAADQLCQIYRDTYNMDVVVTRAFNHAGAYQDERLVIPKFVKQVMNYAFYNKPIEHGNLDARRDFIHVEDVVSAYHQIGVSNENCLEPLNICSARAVSMQEIMNYIIKVVQERYSKWVRYTNFKDNMKQNYFRPNDVPLLEGSYQRTYDIYGWRPKRTLDNIVVDIVEWIFMKDYYQGLLGSSYRIGYPPEEEEKVGYYTDDNDGHSRCNNCNSIYPGHMGYCNVDDIPKSEKNGTSSGTGK